MDTTDQFTYCTQIGRLDLPCLSYLKWYSTRQTTVITYICSVHQGLKHFSVKLKT